jgi:NTP pyrophosphatase (non-canonical NTP hydrolase)
MDIFKLQAEVWKIAEEKGWHDKEISFGEFIALCHSELSEALEIYRISGDNVIHNIDYSDPGNFDVVKPTGIPIELADVIMRILDYCETKGVNMETALERKGNYNKKRDYRHGNKVI